MKNENESVEIHSFLIYKSSVLLRFLKHRGIFGRLYLKKFNKTIDFTYELL